MKVYLDMCCFNRPYDDQSQLRIELETKAKLYIQQLIKNKKLEMVTSFMLRFENAQNPFIMRRDAISDFIDGFSSQFVSSARLSEIEGKINEIKRTGVKQKDATHIACAIFSRCGCFITTDKRLLKFHSDEIEMMNPIELIDKLEGKTW
ncbi:MAG: hypothetical protein IJU98_12510 [Synergistaceae bacterium]|nr:hypothetical protein [Synergistaceae bacterium]